MSTASIPIDMAVEKGHFDPYALNPNDVLEPPTTVEDIEKNRSGGRVFNVDRRLRSES